MAGQLSHPVTQPRRHRALSEQHQVAVAVSESFVSRTLQVLVEGQADARQLKAASVSSWEHGLIRETDHHTCARSKAIISSVAAKPMHPDIDGRVFIRGQLPIGEFARVKVIAHTDYDLIAQPA